MGSSKLPAIQFYPGDWWKDTGVKSLSHHDKGVWFEMLLLMHESPVRGKLMLGMKAMTNASLASVLKVDVETLKETVETLLERGVTEREKRSGALINRRMIRDEVARANFRKRMKDYRSKHKTNGNGDANVTQPEAPYETPMYHPSSSSSSSSTSVKEQKQVPSATPDGAQGKTRKPPKEIDPRHTPFRELCEKYATHKSVTFTWDGSEAKALAALLAATPSLTHEEFHRCLVHRSKSPGTPHGERPRVWLPTIMRYQQGPLNEFNRTEEANANKLGNRKADAANTALARAQARVVAQDGAHDGAGVVLPGPGRGDGRDSPGNVLASSSRSVSG
jgi:DNA-binding transcriptional regulator YhcF (GntR family)